MDTNELYNKLLDLYLNNFQTGDGNYPTTAWLSGMFRKIQDFKNLEFFLNNDNVLPEKREQIEKLKKFKDFAIENNLVKPTTNGFFKITDKGSRLAQSLSSTIEQQKKFDAHRTLFGRSPEYKKLWYDFVAAVNDADKEWASSLSEHDSKLLKIYSELTPKEFSILKGLVRNGKARTKIIKNISEETPEIFEKLVKNKMINPDGTVNNKFITNFFVFLAKSGYSKLKNFNKEISYTIDRSTANKALAKNYADRQLSGSPRANALGNKVSSFLRDIDEDTLNKITKVFDDEKIPANFKDYLIDKDIIDADNTVTTFGKMLKNALKMKAHGHEFKDELVNFNPKLSNATPPSKLSRQSGLASDRTRSFKNFIKRS